MIPERIRISAIAGALIVVGQQLPAQSVGKMLGADVRDFGGDVWAVWTSPVHARGRDWLIAGSAVAASGLASLWDDDVDRWMVEHRNASQWSALREVREGGIAFRDAPQPPPADRDDQYDIEVPGRSDWGQHSLPAGHVANVVACASFLNHRFSMGAIEPALYLVSTGVGVGRLVDRRHWTSDTMLGMVFGYAIGKEVAARSSSRAARHGLGASASSSRFYIAPAASGHLSRLANDVLTPELTHTESSYAALAHGRAQAHSDSRMRQGSRSQ